MNAADYARRLLGDIGCAAEVPDRLCEHPAEAWAASGLMAVTGAADGPGLICPVPVAAQADGAMLALAAMTGVAMPRGAALLGQRARLMGLRRGGAVAPGGACRLLRAQDGWLAVSLARPEDWACAPAWLEQAQATSWDAVAALVRDRAIAELLAQGRLLGLAVARADAWPQAASWCDTHMVGAPAEPAPAPVVVDLSSLWAGPLCGALLHRAGATVIKVESARRPDGARLGHGGFYDFLNGGKASVALDFQQSEGLAALRRLIAGADIVIESARPRALRQLGIDAEAAIAARPGLTWVSITGHGRAAPADDWVGFGDDAGAAGGFCQAMAAAHGPMLFCGDAIADPLTGLHAAVAAWAAWRQGGGRLVSLSLRGVAAHCVATAGPAPGLAARARDWERHLRGRSVKALPLPDATEPARALGADTRSALSRMGPRC